MAADGHLGITALSRVTLASAGLSCRPADQISIRLVKQAMNFPLSSFIHYEAYPAYRIFHKNMSAGDQRLQRLPKYRPIFGHRKIGHFCRPEEKSTAGQLTQGLSATAPSFQDGRQTPSWILSSRK